MDKIRDFNQVVNDLANKLKLCFRDDAGNIYWYKGTIEAIFELLTYLPNAKEYYDE